MDDRSNDSTSWILASFLGHVGLLAASGALTPPVGMDEEGVSDDQRYLVTQSAPDDGEREPEEPDDGAAMGAPRAEPDDERYGVACPADNPDPHVARTQTNSEAPRLDMVGLLPNAGDGPAPTTPWGRDDAGGIGWEPDKSHYHFLMRSHRVGAPRVRYTHVATLELMPDREVRQTASAHAGEFRRCYARELRASPRLAGRVDVGFVVRRDGTVTAVRASGDLSDSVVNCVSAVVSTMRFPARAGAVRVRLPVVMSHW